MDRVVRTTSLREQGQVEAQEWLERTLEERVAAVEAIREAYRIMHGRAEQRLERVVAFAERAPRSLPDRRLKAKLAGLEVAFLGRDELIRNKLAAGRPKDLADIALLSELEMPAQHGTRRGKSAQRTTAVQRPRRKPR